MDNRTLEEVRKNEDRLINELEQLQQENKKLNGAIQTYYILLKANTEENKRLKDNWNKLKEWASNFYNSEEVGWAGCGMRYTLEKMQELEGSEIMSEENMLIIKQINKFGRVLRTPELLKMIEDLEQERDKYKEVIDKVSTRLEYFLIGNLKYQSSQEEFIKLLNILKEVK